MDETDGPAPVLHFEIGGQVKMASTRLDAFSFDGGSISGIDLEDIQPPSEMEGISFINYHSHSMVNGGGGGGPKITDSPQMSSLKNRKALSSSLVARRAIAGSHIGGVGLMRSVESVNSHTNLENVGPPSLMDELLDSMISVDSITSEVASDPLQRTLCGQVEISNYETALSDNEDTMTLISCKDLPLDGNGSSSNCSSNQSTPLRKRRPGSITPKMKRELVRDRFKTYTVDSPEILAIPTTEKEEKGEPEQIVPTTDSALSTDETTRSPESKTPRLSAKQKRQENRSRFQTQILDYSEMRIFEIAPKEEDQQLVEENEDVEMMVVVAEEEKPKDNVIPTQEKKATATTGIKKTLMRFIKPTGGSNQGSNGADSDEVFSPEAPKSIRGRRKPEYVSPYRRPGSAGGAATATPVKPSGGIVKSPNPVSAPASGQKKTTTGLISKLKQVATKKSPTKGGSAEQKKSSTPKDSPRELNRQGTFTKEEPSNNENLPKVSSLPATPTKRLSKLPQVGNGTATSSQKKSQLCNGTPSDPKNGGVVIRRQLSAPNGTPAVGEKRKSMLASPCTGKYSTGQLSERSASTVSIKSNGSNPGKGQPPVTIKGHQEKKLPLSTPTSRSNSTMGVTVTAGKTAINGEAHATSRISLYGRAKGLIPVTSSGKKGTN